MSEREPIPAELRRRVLVEAGHRCAIPTCRHIDVDVHHIVPWESCKKHEYENLIALCPNCHRRAHDEGKIDRKALIMYKANLRFSHDRFSQLEVDVLFECSKRRDEKIPWSHLNYLLLKRLIESGYIDYDEGAQNVFINNVNASPAFISISKSGVDYVESLGIEEL